MQRTLVLVLALASLALVACSDMGSSMGTPGGVTPPLQQNGVQPASTIAAAPSFRPLQPTPTPSAPPGDVATYPFAAAANGIRCPDVNGYSCIVHVNSESASPSPSPSARTSASPSPTPTASPSPSAAPSGSPSPTPSPTPAVTLQLEAQPKDVPAMVHPETDSVATIPLIALRLEPTEDIAIKGAASADFILPPEQIPGRAFALQLFHETIGRRDRRNDRFVGSYAESTIVRDTLHFAIEAPPITIKKGETWLLVLYANEKPLATPSPSPKPSPSLSASPSASPSTSASPSPTPTAPSS
jgi:hypothetical protein